MKFWLCWKCLSGIFGKKVQKFRLPLGRIRLETLRKKVWNDKKKFGEKYFFLNFAKCWKFLLGNLGKKWQKFVVSLGRVRLETLRKKVWHDKKKSGKNNYFEILQVENFSFLTLGTSFPLTDLENFFNWLKRRRESYLDWQKIKLGRPPHHDGGAAQSGPRNDFIKDDTPPGEFWKWMGVLIQETYTPEVTNGFRWNLQKT